jgi:endoribonuclease Dicer
MEPEDLEDPEFFEEEVSDGESLTGVIIGKDNSDGEDDIDADITHIHAPKTSAEQKKAQDALIRAYAAKRTEEITEVEVKEAIKNADDEVLSIKDILAKQEASAKIVNPRDYQNELFEKAKQENIIAVLDTGSGKTHIATLLLRHIIDEELESRAKENPPRLPFFLVGLHECYISHD